MAADVITNQFAYHAPSRRDSESFRNFEASEQSRAIYKKMHTEQCVDFVKKKVAQFSTFDREEMGIMEAAERLCDFLDESDTDVTVPNLYHAFQTAESLRLAHPDQDWLILTGFIHDLGKILYKFGEPQWCVVGDTFPVGCEFSDAIVFGRESFSDNPDLHHPVYSTPYGVYEANCGLDSLMMSWGHDEYLYRVLVNHPQCSLPEEALYIIRFHSFYPFHLRKAYTRFMNEKDERMGDLLSFFSSYDLYSKELPDPDMEKLRPYYQSLIDKYIPGKVKF